MQIYSDLEVLQRLKENIPFWAFDRQDISREFTFLSYLESIEFVNRITKCAEEMDHHPLIIVTWRKILVKTHTHSINAISSLDFTLASEIDKLFISFSI